MNMAMVLLLLILLVAPSSSQIHNYFMYTPYGAPPSLSLGYPVYSSQQRARDSAIEVQYKTTPWNSADYNPSCQTECHSTQYCQRLSPSAECVDGCCSASHNGAQSASSPRSNILNVDANSNGIAQNNATSGMFWASSFFIQSSGRNSMYVSMNYVKNSGASESVLGSAANPQTLHLQLGQQSNERVVFSEQQKQRQGESPSSSQNNTTPAIGLLNFLANSSMASPSAPESNQPGSTRTISRPNQA